MGLNFIPVQAQPEGMLTVAEAIEQLNTRLPDAYISTRQGFGGTDLSYVSWDDSTRIASAIFGRPYWSEHNTSEANHQETVNVGKSGAQAVVTVYEVTKEATFAVYDPAASLIVMFTVTGRGRSVTTPTRDGFITTDAHDIASSAADSDALSRMLKKLGDALGLFLYKKGAATSATQSSGSSATSRQTTGRVVAAAQPRQITAPASGGKTYDGPDMPSVKMRNILMEKGLSDEQARSLTFAQGSDIIGHLKELQNEQAFAEYVAQYGVELEAADGIPF